MKRTLIIDGELPSLNEIIEQNRIGWKAGASHKRKYQNHIGIFINQQLKGVHFTKKVKLAFRWYEEDKNRDFDNISASKKYILDALVENGIIDTDGWRGLAGYTDEFFHDKNNPRIEIDIEEATDD